MLNWFGTLFRWSGHTTNLQGVIHTLVFPKNKQMLRISDGRTTLSFVSSNYFCLFLGCLLWIGLRFSAGMPFGLSNGICYIFFTWMLEELKGYLKRASNSCKGHVWTFALHSKKVAKHQNLGWSWLEMWYILISHASSQHKTGIISKHKKLNCLTLNTIEKVLKQKLLKFKNGQAKVGHNLTRVISQRTPETFNFMN